MARSKGRSRSKPSRTSRDRFLEADRSWELAGVLRSLTASGPGDREERPASVQVQDSMVLIEQLEGPRAPGGRLFVDGDQLPNDQIDSLARWLDQGADRELVLYGEPPSAPALLHLSSRPQAYFIQWPPDLDQLRGLARGGGHKRQAEPTSTSIHPSLEGREAPPPDAPRSAPGPLPPVSASSAAQAPRSEGAHGDEPIERQHAPQETSDMEELAAVEAILAVGNPQPDGPRAHPGVSVEPPVQEQCQAHPSSSDLSSLLEEQLVSASLSSTRQPRILLRLQRPLLAAASRPQLINCLSTSLAFVLSGAAQGQLVRIRAQAMQESVELAMDIPLERGSSEQPRAADRSAHLLADQQGALREALSRAQELGGELRLEETRNDRLRLQLRLPAAPSPPPGR